MHVLLAGASGMIGTALATALRERGDTVSTLVRRAPADPYEHRWDPASGQLDPDVLIDIDAVIGLSGAPVADLPWTAARRRRIMESRVGATRTLAAAINASRGAGTGPETFISASGVNAYGNARPGEILTEDSDTRRQGFLSEVVRAWEGAALEARAGGTRVALLRSGIVTGRGGAFDRIGTLARLGLAGPIGDGHNVWPWISLRDEVRAVLHILDRGLDGPVNLVGPTRATSDEAIRAVAQHLRRPYWLPAPRWAVRATLHDAADDLILVDLTATPKKLTDSGFTFTDTTIEQALATD